MLHAALRHGTLFASLMEHYCLKLHKSVLIVSRSRCEEISETFLRRQEPWDLVASGGMGFVNAAGIKALDL